jgi:hypothetical protein
MERAELQQIEHRLDREIKVRLPAVRRVALLQPGDDPDDLLVRVFVDDQSLDDWARAHESDETAAARIVPAVPPGPAA